MAAIIGGFACAAAIKLGGYLWAMPGWYYSFGNQAPVCLAVSGLLCVAGTLIHPAHTPGTEKHPITFWNSHETLAAGLGHKWHTSVIAWAGLLLILTLGAMLIFSQLFFPVRSGP
jgi:hypothetical protein